MAINVSMNNDQPCLPHPPKYILRSPSMLHFLATTGSIAKSCQIHGVAATSVLYISLSQ